MSADFKYKKVKDIEVEGVKYKIIWKKGKFKKGERTLHHRAETNCPNEPNPQIKISPAACVDDLTLLQTLIDEFFHANKSLWNFDNSYVLTFSDSLGNFLHDVGYHLDTKDKPPGAHTSGLSEGE